MNPLRIYDYLILTRERIFDAVRPLTPEQYGREFPIGLKTIGSTLAHLMISEWYYIERLEAREVPPYEQWPIKYESPPAFDAIERTWREQQNRIRASIAAERDWNRRITYVTFPDDDGRRFEVTVTPGDIVSQLALHEMHHRAQLMSMLRLLGDGARPLQDIDYNDLMYERREVR